MVKKRHSLLLICVLLVLLTLSLSSGPIQGAVNPNLALNQPLALQVRNLQLAVSFNLAYKLDTSTSAQFNQTLPLVLDQFVLPKVAPGDAAAKILSISAEVQSATRVNNIVQTQTLLLLAHRDSFLAEPALVKYDMNNGQAQNVVVQYPYQLPVVAPQTIARTADLTNLQTSKAGAYKLQAIPNAPKDPAQYDYQIQVLRPIDISKLIVAFPTARALANTAANDVPSAVAATNQIATIFGNAGLTNAKLIGPDSTKSALNNYLYNDSYLLAWSNVGHGVTASVNGAPCYGLCQWGETQWASEFATGALAKGLYWCVAFTNSCNSFLDPLKGSILRHYPRTYIGGRVLLPINVSEWSDRDFWYYALIQRFTMGYALQVAAINHGLAGKFGLSGYSGLF